MRWRSGLQVAATVAVLALLGANLGVYSAAQFRQVQTDTSASGREQVPAGKADGDGPWYYKSDWWIAGSTFALFLATSGLWFYTARLWRTTARAVEDGRRGIEAAIDAARAADLHARTAVALQLPILRLDWPKTTFCWGDAPVIPRQVSIRALLLGNVGATAATLTQIRCGWTVAEALVGEPIYTEVHPLPQQRLIGTERSRDHYGPDEVPLQEEISFNDDQMEALEAFLFNRGSTTFWFYGSIEYLDFLDNVREQRWCWSWDRHTSQPGAFSLRVSPQWITAEHVPAAYVLRR